MFSCTLCVLIIAGVLALGSGELFSSMAHLQNALHTEQEIAREIRHYVEAEQQRLKKLTEVADEFEQHSSSALQDPDYYMGNPVNAFLFVKHFTIDWDKDVEDLLRNNTITDLSVKLEELRERLPNYEDLQGSVSALLRLQDTYKLDTSEIAQGNVGGVATAELTAWDCYELGRLAYNSEDFYHTIMWMDVAMAKLLNTDDDEDDDSNAELNVVSILDYLSFSLFKQGNIRRALSLTNEMLEIVPEHTRAQSNKMYYEKVLKTADKDKRGDTGEELESENKRQLDEYRSGEEYTKYEALCRGENIQTYKHQHLLSCQYVHNGHPLLILSPAKQEILYFRPYIVMYHNSISDFEIQLMKSTALPKLGRATVHNPKTGKLESAQYRVSKSCWLSVFDNPDIGYINDRIAAMTGLTMDTAEELQIANYGIGGQYEPHFDFARKEENAFKELNTGNRIATYMFYLSDVQRGGATVFPYLGLKVFPTKGAGIFWYNLYKNGDGIYNTRHAACPVLVGSKWVANKWIHERGQEFLRPCGLEENE